MLKYQTGKSPALGMAVLRGTMIGLGLAVLGAAALASLVDRELLKMEQIGYGIMAVHLVAVFLSAKAAMARGGHMQLPAAALTGAAYYLCLLLINGAFFGGSPKGLGTTFLLVTISAVAAIVTEGKGHGKGRRRRYKIPK